MQMGFYFDQTRCTACFACVVTCKNWHDVPPGPASRRRVTSIEKRNYPNLFVAHLSEGCRHCANPACIAACPADAITKREADGIVVVDQEACLGRDGCGLCLDACPWDYPQFGPYENARIRHRPGRMSQRADQGQDFARRRVRLQLSGRDTEHAL
ncbi:MAG: 4Fe-4S dicluster domain-containing protein [Chloroflexota bacterium]|nr:MAG: 4Fe-4S dicluster domain-containing protein [Chloroflexota bacterium]